MKYKRYSLLKFFKEVSTEKCARDMIWHSRFGEDGFKCPECGSKEYYQFQSNEEIRECKQCHHHLRVRVGTIFEKSHLPLLVWVRAIFLMTQSKRGLSALELKRQLGLSRYATSWSLLRKIRHALKERDQRYQIEGIIELDGAHFGKKQSGTHKQVLVGVETKRWWDENGKIRQRAGFAKVLIGTESHEKIQSLMESSIKTGSTFKTDGLNTYKESPDGAEMLMKVMNKDPKNSTTGYHGFTNLFPMQRRGYLAPTMDSNRANTWIFIWPSTLIGSIGATTLADCSTGH